MDILERLQAAMYGESAIHAPRTTEAIEAMREAKAEIERLREEKRAVLLHVVELRAEIQRLKAGYGIVVTDRNALSRDLADAQAEIGRLRAAIQRIDRINENPADHDSEINAICDSILRRSIALINGRSQPGARSGMRRARNRSRGKLPTPLLRSRSNLRQRRSRIARSRYSVSTTRTRSRR
jgi:chromosome segregation ATPase